MVEWLKKQWDWIKSFISEPPDANGYVKGSQKRFLSFWVVIAFVAVWFKKTMSMKPEEPIPDIPPTWALLILAVLGLGIYANHIASKNKIEEIEAEEDVSEEKKKRDVAIVKLHRRLKKLEDKDEPEE